ncbi:unnamed protein product [Spirodela intermedia]|uniref:Uncharacterized protein n=1 Tax=Spirodela intermedia TaxID=51605 RepID=A0A7I8L240_SPIIN|nr:unnamed protein product [Spirodela intermedia]
MKIFGNVQLSILLTDAIRHVLTYAKFLMKLCTPHRKIRKIQLSENASAIIQIDLPRKMKDPGTPLITCKIGGISFQNALLDLGASVSLMLAALYEQFQLGELKPTTVILQLVDRSAKTPRRLVEDVIVKIKGCRYAIIKWDGPYNIINIEEHGAILIDDLKLGQTFKVNSQRLKPYFEHELKPKREFIFL